MTFSKASDYAEVEPASGTLEVRPAGDPSTMLALPGVEFKAGGIYTIIVTGRAKATQDVEAILIEDRFGAGTSQ